MTRIKICGITTLVDGLAAAAAGADAIGLVFHPPSPRYIAAEQAAEWVGGLPPFLCVVGLFVNRPVEEIHRISALCRLDRIQLHGDESPEFCAQISRPVIKAVRVGGAEDLRGVERYAVSALLVDAKHPAHYGGTGQRFDWQLVQGFPAERPMILAGGLQPDNVQQAVRQVRPYAVDVSTGVEAAPGIKDPEKMARFVAEVRQAATRW